MTIKAEREPNKRLASVRKKLAALWRQEPRWGRMEKILDLEAEHVALVREIKSRRGQSDGD